MQEMTRLERKSKEKGQRKRGKRPVVQFVFPHDEQWIPILLHVVKGLEKTFVALPKTNRECPSHGGTNSEKLHEGGKTAKRR